MSIPKPNKTKWKEMSILSKEQKNKWDSSVGKVVYHQTWWSEVNSQKTHRRRGKPTPTSCPLASAHRLRQPRPQAVATPPTSHGNPAHTRAETWIKKNRFIKWPEVGLCFIRFWHWQWNAFHCTFYIPKGVVLLQYERGRHFICT